MKRENHSVHDEDLWKDIDIRATYALRENLYHSINDGSGDNEMANKLEFFYRKPEFWKTIDEARRKLGISNNEPVAPHFMELDPFFVLLSRMQTPDNDQLNEANIRLDFKSEEFVKGFEAAKADGITENEYKSTPKKFAYLSYILNEIANKMGVDNKSWRSLIASIILNVKNLYLEISVFPDKHIKVIGVYENGEITIKLKPGLSGKTYGNAWKAFRDYLGKPKRKITKRPNIERDLLIYEDLQKGLTHKEISEKYGIGKEPGDYNAISHIGKIKKRNNMDIK